jgi:hypothetical protein
VILDLKGLLVRMEPLQIQDQLDPRETKEILDPRDRRDRME